MKPFLKNLTILAAALGASSYAYAVPVCNVGNVCETPAAATQTTLVINAASLLGVQCLNSIGPNGNQTNSNYFFAVSDTDLGATVANGGITNSGTGLRVVGVVPTHNASAATGSSVGNGRIDGTKGGTAYWVYAQACPSGTAANGTNCSSWAKIDASQVTTTAYPLTVFQAAPTKPTDATNNSISVHTTIPAGDVSSVSVLTNQTINDLITPANSQAIADTLYTGNGSPYVVGTSAFSFLPNTKYNYLGQVQYPWDNVPIAGQQTVGPFWTTPDNPSNVVVSNITHCSVQVTANNAAGPPPNPTYTVYNLCVTGTGGSCLSGAIGGIPAATDTISKTIAGLIPGTSYTPNAQALVGNGSDATATGWNSSTIVNGTPFTTLTFGGTFTITQVGFTSSTFNVSGLTGAGSIASWQILVDGSGAGQPSGVGDPTGSHALTGFTPNTHHTVTIQLTETSGCSSTLPVTPVGFTTDAQTPTAFTLGTPSTPTSLTANWTDTLNLSANTAYTVQTCTDAGFTTGCTNTTTAKGVTTANITGLTPETLYFAHVKAVNVDHFTATADTSGGLDSPFSTSASTTTPNAAPVVTSVTCTAASTATPATSSCSGVATDNASVTQLLCHWSATGPASVTFTPPTDAAGVVGPTTCGPVTASFPALGTYTVTLTVTDHNGTGLSGSKNATVVVGASASVITIAPLSATVITGNTQLFTATVKDQFGSVIVGQTVNWSVNGGGSVAPASGASTTFTAATPGSFTLTAALPGATSGTAALTVVAAGPHVDSLSFVMAAGNKGGTLTLVGHDNVAHSVTSTYSSTPAGATFTPSSTTSADGIAANTAVTFPSAGAFTLTANLGSGVSSSTVVNVPQILTGLKVCEVGDASCAKTVTLKVLQTQQFTAIGVDQFGNSMALGGGVTWSGNVSANGASASFSSPTLGQTVTITATSGLLSGSINVNLVNFDVSGSFASPVPYKASSGVGSITFRNLGSQWTLHLYTTSGRRIFDISGSTDTYPWNVKNSSGESIASGVYFYVIESPEGKKNGKLIIIQ